YETNNCEKEFNTSQIDVFEIQVLIVVGEPKEIFDSVAEEAISFKALKEDIHLEERDANRSSDDKEKKQQAESSVSDASDAFEDNLLLIGEDILNEPSQAQEDQNDPLDMLAKSRVHKSGNLIDNDLQEKVFVKMSVEKIIKSPGVPLTVPEGSFLKTLFKDANKWMTKHAIECCESGVTYTYSELLDQIKNWSEFLKSLDLDHQDSVTIISPNCLQYVPILLGTISLGIPVLPL
ncbi:hypothetical protein Avbf_11149, partial [Armadillidium vulgare]